MHRAAKALSFFLFGLDFVFAINTYAYSLKITSHYYDIVSSKRVKVFGHGFLVNFRDAQGKVRKFAVTAAHVSQGQLLDISYDASRYLSTNETHFNWRSCRILGRAANLEEDLEIIEVDECGESLFTYHPKLGFVGNLAFPVNEKIINSFSHIQWLYSSFVEDPQVGVFEELRNLRGDIVSNIEVVPGLSGSPLIGHDLNDNEALSARGYFPVPKFNTRLKGVAKSTWRFFGQGKYVHPSQLYYLLRDFTEGRYLKNEELNWKITGGTLHLDVGHDISDLATFETKSGNGISADGGNGLSADGGNGLSADGGNGLSADGGNGLSADGGNENTPETYLPFLKVNRPDSLNHYEMLIKEIERFSNGELSPGMIYKSSKTIGFEVATTCPNLETIYIYASVANYLYLKRSPNTFQIRQAIPADTDLRYILRKRYLSKNVSEKALRERMKRSFISLSQPIRVNNLLSFSKTSKFIQASDFRNVYFLDFEDAIIEGSSEKVLLNDKESLCAHLSDSWHKGFIKKMYYNRTFPKTITLKERITFKK